MEITKYLECLDKMERLFGNVTLQEAREMYKDLIEKLVEETFDKV